ncbi:MAG: DapH/DapD/GlmU-related protein [Bacilli bacterium]|jgi:UDP-3-O-[3-hydroxymyristoyl] glucosamine N-acyltransferase LpxD
MSFFEVNVSKYVPHLDFLVTRPASLNNPKDRAVMFVTEEYIKNIDSLLKVKECLVFVPKDTDISKFKANNHAFILCDDPRREYSKFYRDNNITDFRKEDTFDISDGAYIAKGAIIGNNVGIMPGAYICSDAKIGDNVYIGSGVKIIGPTEIGNNVIIRENSVIGTSSISTHRDENGEVLITPQFGRLIIEDNVLIGANTTIGRGAIDDTIVHRGCKIASNCVISHNVQLGENTIVIGQTILFGRVVTGRDVYISGGVTVRDGIHIGDRAFIGMGSVVVKDVPADVIVKGNPAK